MNKLISFFVAAILLAACKKEDNNIIWERSSGPGKAYFVASAPDSGILCCGVLSGNPYLVKYSRNKVLEYEFASGREGLYSSAWCDTSCFIAAGSSNGRMLLERLDVNGISVWDTTISAGFYLDVTSLVYTGNGNFVAIGSASPDSADNGTAHLLFVRFDTTGLIPLISETSGTDFLSSPDAACDAAGNIYLPMTKKSGSQKPKALIAKYNSDLQKLWETEIYNNPSFAAGCFAVAVSGQDVIYVTGNTEAANASGTLDNSFLVSVSKTGVINWKKYIENSNSGASVITGESGDPVMLNRNCFIIRKANADDGSDAGIIRMFSECDSYTTDAFGFDMDYSFDGNFLCAGSLGGNFYVAIKSSQ